MITQYSAKRPLWVDYKEAGTTAGRNPRRIGRLSTAVRRKPTLGAVRLSAGPQPRFQHIKKASAGLVLIAGGILMNTTSTGKVTKPELRFVPQALAMVSPTFYFDDRDDALGANQQVLAAEKPDVTPTVVAGLQQSAMLKTTFSAAETVYDEQAADTAAAFVNNATLLNVPSNSAPQIADVSSPIMDNPAVAAVRKNAESPTGSTEELVTVAAGDTLSRVLNDRGVSIDQMPQLLTDEIVKKYLSNLRIGQELKILRNADGDFHSLSARVGNDRRINVRRSTGGFAVASIDLPVEKERVVTSGTIEHSLYIAAEEAHLKQSTIMELSDIFQWELDFARDIRKGDEFSLVYDRLYREGKYIGDGDILAAEFVRGGKNYRAIRFTDPEGNTGYYSPDGRSKRRTFLRHPVDVVRITSRFDPNRVHPVLHKIRAHKGVDYGSPSGTPIRATANGVIAFAGTKNTYGKTVILKHGTDTRTLYAHMSRISKKVKQGKRVNQGDVIGYVGATGRVTGAHLHYEFQKNGKHVDPLKVELPVSAKLKPEYLDSLRAVSDNMLAQMRSVLNNPDDQVAAAQ